MMFFFYVGVLPASSLLALCQYIGAYTDLHKKFRQNPDIGIWREKNKPKIRSYSALPDTLPMGPHAW